MDENNNITNRVKKSPKKPTKKLDAKSMLNSLGMKKYLLIALLAIMIPLLLIYALIHNKIPKNTVLIPTNAEQTKEEETTGENSIVPEGVTLANEPASDVNDDIPETTTERKEETTARWMAKIIDPTDEEYWFLAIVGVNYPLPDKYVPMLSSVIEGDTITVDSRVAAHYQEMYNAAKKDDCILTPYSGYHNYSLQKSTYNRKVNFYVNQGLSQEEAEKKAQLSVLPEGCSEHNAGLAVDIVKASEDFAKTKEYNWLCDHAYEYGFILRYPKDKTEITGMNYQPWHWRYVGIDAAEKIHDKEICLEEYLGIVK